MHLGYREIYILQYPDVGISEKGYGRTYGAFLTELYFGAVQQQG